MKQSDEKFLVLSSFNSSNKKLSAWECSSIDRMFA